MFDIRKLWALNPLSIAFIYLAFAILWILASDAILESFVSEPTLLSNLQTLKGLLYVFFTAALLFLLIKKSTASIEQDRNSLNNSLFAAKMATWDMDVRTNIITRSNNHFKLFGLNAGGPEWTLEDFISKIHPDDRVKVSESFKKAFEKGEVYNVEYRVVWPDGSIHYMWSRGTLVRNEDGKAERVSGVISDITDRVQLEKDYFHKTDLFENIFENIPVMVNITSSDLTEFRVNKNFVEVLGWGNENMSPQEMLVSCYPNEDYRNQVLEYISHSNPKKWRDFKVTSKSGEVKTQRWTNFKLENGTNIGIGIDVTEAREIERELQNQKEELQESRDRYKKAEEIAKIGHWERNLLTDEAVWSEGFYNLIGFKQGEISTRFEGLLSIVLEEDKEAFKQSFEDAFKTGIFEANYRVKLNKSGGIVYLHEIGEVEYQNKKPVFLRGTIQDITDIKEFERSLEERTDFIETTLDNLPISVAVNKIDEGTATLMNKTFSDIYGWPEEEIVDVNTFFEKVYPDPEYRQEIMTMILYDLKSRNPDRMNWNGIKITTKSGEKRVVNAKNITLYDQNLMISTVLDVTDLFEKTSENERIFEHSSELMCIVDQNGVMKRINKSWTKTLGWTLEELQSKPIIEFFHPDDKDLSYRLINELLTEKKPVSITNRMISKSGKYHTLSWNSVIDPDGENIFGVAREKTFLV